jgi:hypothetical protein
MEVLHWADEIAKREAPAAPKETSLRLAA